MERDDEPLESRLVELELRYMAQQDVIEALEREVLGTNQRGDQLEKRVKRLEESLQELLRVLDAPANERPPHY
jgi:SlyX protein